jgi:hypothetical protein
MPKSSCRLKVFCYHTRLDLNDRMTESLPILSILRVQD